MVLMCFTSADESPVPAVLPESSQTGVSTVDEAVGFTVLGEVEPRSQKKVCNWSFSISEKSRS